MEEDSKIYIAIHNKEELMKKVDDLIWSENIKECEIEGRKTITKDEIINLFKLEKSMCKIIKKLDNNSISKGAGFLCELKFFQLIITIVLYYICIELMLILLI